MSVLTSTVRLWAADLTKKLKEFCATADVFVLPSSCEAFGIAALEGIAAGTAVVLADLGGLSAATRCQFQTGAFIVSSDTFSGVQ